MESSNYSDILPIQTLLTLRSEYITDNILTNGLPPDHIISQMGRLRTSAQCVFATLRANDHDGNQWIVVHNLTPTAVDKLYNDNNILRIPFRFQLEGTTGLIRIIFVQPP